MNALVGVCISLVGILWFAWVDIAHILTRIANALERRNP